MLTGIIDSGQKIVTNGLVLHLDAAQLRSHPTTGTTWTDLSGNGNNGTLVNGAAYNSANGGSIVFDGVDDFIDFSSETNLIPTAGLTIDCWFRTSKVDMWLVNKYSPTTAIGYAFNGTRGGTPAIRLNARVLGGTVTYANNIWQNWVATWTPSISLVLYRNGSQNAIATTTIPASITDPSYGFEIGRRPNGPDYWLGDISIVRIYNRALSENEVVQNYNATKSRYGL